MIVTWLGHAQLFINAAGKTLLLDPWFAEPVFGGAWFRYPPPPYPVASSLPPPNFLLLSHIHPDHSGPKTLAQLSNTTPTFAMPFPSGALKRRLARANYTNVEWLEPWETRELSPGLKITFVAHDRGWEVSSIIVEADGVRLYHGNDNPLSVAAYAVVGMADQVSVVIRQTLVQLSTPDALRGRVSAVNMIFIQASNQLGAAESGFLAAATSPTFAVVFGGVGALVVAAITAWRLPELRRYEIGAGSA